MDCNESVRIDNIAKDSWYCAEVNTDMIKYSFEIFNRYITRPCKILEMGPAEGVMTDYLVKITSDLTVLDGAKTFCDILHERHPDITIINCLFEDYSPSKKYDVIILGHVLEHVEKPVDILKLASSWLSKDGIIIGAVPNSHSLHRQAAVFMGLLSTEDELNDTDRHHGHRRVYSIDKFKSDFINAGLTIEKIGGYWLKPVSNKQLEESWTKEMMNAYMKLGELYPDIAAEIYIVAKN